MSLCDCVAQTVNGSKINYVSGEPSFLSGDPSFLQVKAIRTNVNTVNIKQFEQLITLTNYVTG